MPSSCFTELSEAMIDAERSLSEAAPTAPVAQLPAVTISRQAGSGGREVAECLAKLLGQGSEFWAPRNWPIWETELVRYALELGRFDEHALRFFQETGPSTLRDGLRHALGLHPPIERMIQETNRAISQLAQAGGCIVIGRGAHLVSKSLKHAFHVRLVGSFQRRVARHQDRAHCGLQEAIDWVEAQEKARADYVRTWFQEDIADCSQYDLVINTDRCRPEAAASLVQTALLATREGI
jgi:cytidylate kinase